MNWVDVVLIGTLLAGGLLGMRIGMVRASFGALGVVAGFVVVAHFRDDAASWVTGYFSNTALVEMLSYVITISATAAATVAAAAIVRKMVYGMFMGWADRLAGMTAGVAVAAALAATVVLGLAGLSDAKNIRDEGVAAKVLEFTPFDSAGLSGFSAQLPESALISAIVGAADIIPDRAFDMVPKDWRDALDRLEHRLEGMESAHR
jgi:uncharacterized membrane protein required for colicin V production